MTGFHVPIPSMLQFANGASEYLSVPRRVRRSRHSANSTLSIEISGNGGAGQPTGHDQLQRGSNLTLIGTLTVVETGTVPDGDYTIISLSAETITGTFSSTNLPANYSVIYNSNNVFIPSN